MSRLLRRFALTMRRHEGLGSVLAATFGTVSTFAAGETVPGAVRAGCTGPYGTGYCGSSLCTGRQCRSRTNYATCGYVRGFCYGTSPCWRSGTHYCCDCRCCTYYGSCFYCYCHGA